MEKFLDIYLDEIKINWINSKKEIPQQSVYKDLHSSFLRLRQVLKPDSPFFELYEVCDKPFDKKDNIWPIAHCHGQTLPINIIYNEIIDKYYFIDYEPENMGEAPFAYDYCFFILYKTEILSLDYKMKLKKELSNFLDKYKFQKAFLAQILWWSRNRPLNNNQILKINKRSKSALSFFVD